MTNNERLYEIIDKHRHDVDMDFSADIRHYKNTNETVDGITSLIKELVAEARIDELQMIETAQQNTDQWGNFCIDDTSDFSNYIGSRISELEQNLLKALEEV